MCWFIDRVHRTVCKKKTKPFNPFSRIRSPWKGKLAVGSMNVRVCLWQWFCFTISHSFIIVGFAAVPLVVRQLVWHLQIIKPGWKKRWWWSGHPVHFRQSSTCTVHCACMASIKSILITVQHVFASTILQSM
jgi:hypothetical protein